MKLLYAYLLLVFLPTKMLCLSIGNRSESVPLNTTFLNELKHSYLADLKQADVTNLSGESIQELQLAFEKAFSNLQDCDFYHDIIEYSAYLSQISYCINEQDSLKLYPDKSFKFPEQLQRESVVQYNEQFNGTSRYQLVKLIENKNTDDSMFFLGGGEGFILLDHKFKRISIVFRGSRHLEHWVTNLTFLPTPYKFILSDKWYRHKFHKFQAKENKRPFKANGILDDYRNQRLFFVHKGFYKVSQDIMDPIMLTLLEYLEIYPDYQIFIMGHSLGGAISQIISLELASIKVNHMVLTFNAPGLFSNDLSCYYDELMDTSKLSSDKLEEIGGMNILERASIRIFHHRDIVPFISPRLVYRHVGYGITVQKKEFPHKLHDLFHLMENEDTGMLSLNIQDEKDLFVLSQYYEEIKTMTKDKIKEKIQDTLYFHRHLVVFFSACNTMSIDDE